MEELKYISDKNNGLNIQERISTFKNIFQFKPSRQIKETSSLQKMDQVPKDSICI